MEPIFIIKAELAFRGRKIKDLSLALGWEYGKVSRILNGFQPISPDFESRVRKIINDWDGDKIKEMEYEIVAKNIVKDQIK